MPAEAIARTNPAWAYFSDTDIGPEVLTADHDIIEIAWVRHFGQYVTVCQDVDYGWGGEMIGSASFPHIEMFTEAGRDFHDPDEVVALATALTDAAVLLSSIHDVDDSTRYLDQ